MKKIAYCLISDGMGGAENIVHQTLKHFNDNKSFYLIVNNEIAHHFYEIISPERILNIGDIYLHRKYKQFRYVLNNRFYNLRKWSINQQQQKVNQFVKDNSIDILHSHLDYALYLGLKIKNATLPHLKVVFTVHSAFGFLEDKTLKPQLPFKHIDFSKVDSFIFVSNYVYDIYKAEMPIVNYQIIYNGIEGKEDNNIIRNYHSDDNFNILYLGGDKLVKGYDILFETIDILVNKKGIKNIKVFVLGSVSSKGNLKMMIERSNLESYFEIVGFVNSCVIKEYFDKAHILFMPSRTEAMPLAAIEAVFYDLPIIATEVGGLPEIISTSKNGYCVELDAPKFSNVIETSMLSYSALSDTTVKYNKCIKNSFSLNFMCDSLLTFYRTIDS